jgi:acyl-CoA thioester hydrolase
MASPETGGGFRWSVRVRFGDTDPYGVVYFVSFFRYMKDALDEFLRARGLPPEQTYRDCRSGRGLPVIASSARFTSPVRYGETLDIEVTVAACTERSVKFGFRFMRGPADEPVADGEITCVAIDGEWRATLLPPEWRQRLAGSASPPPNHP